MILSSEFALRTVSLVVLVFIHLSLQMRFVRAWPDWDTASHLYFGFLKHRHVSFQSSYKLGVKWALPRLYALMWPLLEGRVWRFRIANMLAGSVALVGLVVLSPNLDSKTLAVLLLGVLLIDSAYVNAPTSASEFLTAPLAMIALGLGEYLPWPFNLYAQSALILLLGLGFKIVDLAYMFPVLIQHRQTLLDQFEVSLPALVLFIGIGMRLVLSRRKDVKAYAMRRGLLHPKSVRFVLTNLLYVLAIIWISLANAVNGSLIVWVTLGTLWGVLLIQRMYVSYFWYPLILFNLYFAVQLQWYLKYETWIVWMLPLAFFLVHTLWFLRYSPQELVDDFVRKHSFFTRHRRDQLVREQRQVDWLKKNIPPSSEIYLWGSKTVLPLMAGLTHVGTTFYNHNHIFYWSDVPDKSEYAATVVNDLAPDFVIQCEIIDGVSFPADQFEGRYSRVCAFEEMQVFQRIGENWKGEL